MYFRLQVIQFGEFDLYHFERGHSLQRLILRSIEFGDCLFSQTKMRFDFQIFICNRNHKLEIILLE